MHISYYPYRLNFKYPFKIAHTERAYTDNVYLKIEHLGKYGFGECVFIPYYPETLDSFLKLIKSIKIPEDIHFESIPGFINDLKEDYPNDRFSIAAIDIALHNLCTHLSGVRVIDFYKIPGNAAETSFTIGICDKATMKQKLADYPNMSYYKLKVDQNCIEQMVTDFIGLTDKPFVVDANQGFKAPDRALYWCHRLKDLGVQYIEQPFDKLDFELHSWLKDLSPIPIIADESFQKLADIDLVRSAFDGINIKLMKMGGISEAYAAIHAAKKLGLKTLIGCMSESSIAIDAASKLAPLVDWVDLDGAMLLTNDPFSPEMRSSDEERIKLIKKYSRQGN